MIGTTNTKSSATVQAEKKSSTTSHEHQPSSYQRAILGGIKCLGLETKIYSTSLPSCREAKTKTKTKINEDLAIIQRQPGRFQRSI